MVMAGLVAAGLGLVVLEIAVRAWRLRRLLAPEQRPGFPAAVTINAYGDVASALTPGRLGGDPARFLGVRRAGIPTPAALVALASERIIDWVVMGVVAFALGGAAGTGALKAMAELTRRLVDPSIRPWLVGVALLVAGGIAVIVRYRRRHPQRIEHSLRETWRSARSLGLRTLGVATTFTVTSVALRVAVLPILVWPWWGQLDLTNVWLASFALLYGQLILPTPAGVGVVELAFAVGFEAVMDGGELAAVLILWRILTLGVGAALGGFLFLRNVVRRSGKTA